MNNTTVKNYLLSEHIQDYSNIVQYNTQYNSTRWPTYLLKKSNDFCTFWIAKLNSKWMRSKSWSSFQRSLSCFHLQEQKGGVASTGPFMKRNTIEQESGRRVPFLEGSLETLFSKQEVAYYWLFKALQVAFIDGHSIYARYSICDRVLLFVKAPLMYVIFNLDRLLWKITIILLFIYVYVV